MATSFDNTMADLGITRSSSASQALANATGKSTLGQEDFLTLMTAQMQNQDPFDPIDNTQMVSQMAQFSSLSGQEEMNSTLQAIAAKLGATSSVDALGWVGKTVLTEGDTAYPLSDGSLQAAVELDEDATDVTVVIQDADGKLMRRVSLGPQEAGTAQFVWDGTTEDGESAGTGPFTITTQAENADGDVASRTLVWAPVNSVQMTNDGDPLLSLPGLGQVPASAVRSVG
ncbi:flagellar hook assembly protein FlgD [Stakelama saccharophila]|uniref:Basal-body rod modification protein FlgD n=1 Tax=Stakelama saccharophila TaxID=3075605 RepID=A0ABZ0B8D2_9SPHN|nr:flagellar hook assembly protein FlgD [Stakelama sp. W311]WNO53676.1 flagellar hook assembly protein FlgD [Stakelama sp. W311]